MTSTKVNGTLSVLSLPAARFKNSERDSHFLEWRADPIFTKAGRSLKDDPTAPFAAGEAILLAGQHSGVYSAGGVHVPCGGALMGQRRHASVMENKRCQSLISFALNCCLNARCTMTLKWQPLPLCASGSWCLCLLALSALMRTGSASFSDLRPRQNTRMHGCAHALGCGSLGWTE